MPNRRTTIPCTHIAVLRVTIEIFDADLLVPSTLHDACDAHGVVAVALVDLHFQRRLRVPGIDADDGQPNFVQLGPEPCRCCSRLEPDPCNMRRMRLDECGDCLRVGYNHPFAFDLPCLIDDADRCQLQRHV